jgi:hypothetical protein
MVILNRNSTELILNHIYFQMACFIQLTATKFVQTKELYTADGGKLWAGSRTSASNDFQRLSDVCRSAET